MLEVRESAVQVGDCAIGAAYPVRIMGVVNLSPDSFYKDSVITDTKDLAEKVRSMIEQGADLIDIGGASSSPKNIYNREESSVDEEIARASAAFKALREISSVPLSIDTTSAAVAEVALDLGAHLVNDVSGLMDDSEMAETVAKRDVPIVLMASCRSGCTSVEMSLNSLRESLRKATRAGIDEERTIIDPGIGFGKKSEVDFSILRNLRLFTYLRRPVLVGLSRKAFIGEYSNQKDPSGRLLGSVAATSLAVFNGADVIRTHDVTETVIAARIGEATRDTRSSRGGH